jgi:LGFP repeat
MAQKCVGSMLGEDWAVYTREDAIVCENAGGRVVQTSDVCGASSVAAMAMPDNPTRGALAELALAPFREVRAEAADHELVQALVKLNRTAGPEIERIAAADEGLHAELVQAFLTVGGLATAVTRKLPTQGRLEERTFRELEAFGRRIADRTNSHEVRSGIESVLTLARQFIGRDLVDIGATLRNPQNPQKRTTTSREAFFPSETVLAIARNGRVAEKLANVPSSVGIVIAATSELMAAISAAIAVKAASLGWVGRATGEVTSVPGGWRQRFENADILVGTSRVAFEVHGDIRAKYNMLGGPGGPLGLPVTDETGTADGIGRFNHFENGSIYWTNNTGPMMVQGRVRDEWANQRWEQGPMGYPVEDQRHMPPLTGADHPNLGWCVFQNGALFSVAGAGATALAGEATPEQLRVVVRNFFDRALKAKRPDIGLEARVDLDAVSDWAYGFWAALPRMLSFGLHGFISTGSTAIPDPTFDIQIRLRFSATWPTQSFLYPSVMSLIVALDWMHVHVSGFPGWVENIAQDIHDGVHDEFYRGVPDPEHPEVPNGAIFLISFPTGANQTGTGGLDVIDVLTTAAGGLQVLLNPLPPFAGTFRKTIAQQQVDAFVAG